MSADFSLKSPTCPVAAAISSTSVLSRSNVGTPPLGALVRELQAVLVARARIGQDDRRSWVLDQVQRALAHELVGQRDAFHVDDVDRGQEHDVRHARPVGRGQDRRDPPLDTAAQVLDGQQRAIAAHRGPPIAPPARGPGVWSNMASTRTVHAT
jgi:hypothetical protein